MLRTNYVTFQFTKASNALLYQHNVSVTRAVGDNENTQTSSSEIKGKKRARIIKLFLETVVERERHDRSVTDFGETLISLDKWKETRGSVSYYAEQETAPHLGAIVYNVTIVFTGRELSLDKFLKDLETPSFQGTYEEKLPIIQALNISFNYGAKLSDDVVTIGTSKRFGTGNSPEESQDLQGGLVATRGVFTSVRATTGRMLLNINNCHAAFYKAVPSESVASRIQALKTAHYSDEDIRAYLKKVRVLVRHLGRVKTICDLATIDDGKGLVKPPQFPERLHNGKPNFDPWSVEFWLDPPKGSEESGRYITVARFFEESKCYYPSSTGIVLITVNRTCEFATEHCLQNLRRRERGDQAKAGLFTTRSL